jgi:hypothetical protein
VWPDDVIPSLAPAFVARDNEDLEDDPWGYERMCFNIRAIRLACTTFERTFRHGILGERWSHDRD